MELLMILLLVVALVILLFLNSKLTKLLNAQGKTFRLQPGKDALKITLYAEKTNKDNPQQKEDIIFSGLLFPVSCTNNSNPNIICVPIPKKLFMKKHAELHEPIPSGGLQANDTSHGTNPKPVDAVLEVVSPSDENEG